MAALPAFFGYNFTFWIIVSVMRFLSEHLFGRKQQRAVTTAVSAVHLTPRDVAVILAAHNEALSLPATLTALKKNLPAEQIYIGSDASTDETAAVARALGCNVVELHPNRGKAKTLVFLLHHFGILERYRAVLIMDAEVIVSDTYLKTILPYFDDPRVAAFVSHAISRWQRRRWPSWSMFFTAYRVRLWLMLYYGLRYGQTWKYTSVTPIVPGGSSVYRSTALKQIEIDTPGLIIEDFHMTFQIHHKKLGRIASHPSAYIIDQEPYSLRDYSRQVYRWFLGFWQTFFHHGFWPSAFWFATALFTLEMLIYSVLILTTPIALLAILFTPLKSFVFFRLSFQPLGIDQAPVTMTSLLISVLAVDYLMTTIAAIIERKPALMIYGVGFFILRYTDTLIFLWTLPLALLKKHTLGIWKSPARKPTHSSA